MNEEIENNKFTWGDAVVIAKSAPTSFHPGEFASVCGFYKMSSEENAKKFQCDAEEWVYTVEFGNGSDIQVPESYLDKNLGIIPGREFSEYSTYFVNGFVSNIKMNINYIEMQIKSAPIHQTVFGNILISNDGCFSGNLIIPQIQEVVIHNSSLSMDWKEKGTILKFEISDYLLELQIEWRPAKTTSFHIKSGQIWWEQG